MSTRGKGEREPLQPLIDARTKAGLSQSALDERVGLSRGTLAQLEKGILLPPDKGTCSALDTALDLEPGTMWAACVPFRLRRFDPELATWHREELARVSDLPAESLELLDTLRELAAEYGRRDQVGVPYPGGRPTPLTFWHRSDHRDGGTTARVTAFLRAVMAAGPKAVHALSMVLHQVGSLGQHGKSEAVERIMDRALEAAQHTMLPEAHGGTGISLDGTDRPIRRTP